MLWVRDFVGPWLKLGFRVLGLVVGGWLRVAACRAASGLSGGSRPSASCFACDKCQARSREGRQASGPACPKFDRLFE